MRKMIMLIGLSITLLQGCATYKPLIDSAGQSGTFNESKAKEITNDLQHCKTLAKDNTNMVAEGSRYVWNYYFRSATLWLSDKVDYKYPKIYKNCMKNRGHSVVN